MRRPFRLKSRARHSPTLRFVEQDLAYGRSSLRTRPWSTRAFGATADWAGREGLLVFVAAVYVAALGAFGRAIVSIDSWLALAVGRLITVHGIPSHDTLTVFAHGRRWIDQQWLAQLAIYELDRLGGLRLAVVIHVLLLAASLAAAMAVARLRGAGARSVAVVTTIALFPLLVSTVQLRTQSFAYPLFVAVLALASTRKPLTWSRLGLSLALLCLWANLHGSVILGAGLVALRGATDLFDNLHTRRRPSILALATIALPWPCLLVTPFPLGVPHYYAETVFNPEFARYLGQWQPSTLSLGSLLFFVLALGWVWLLGRSGSSFSRFEKLAGLALVVFALLAMRNWVWLALGAVVFYPRALDRSAAKARAPLPTELNQVSAIAGIVFAFLAAVMLAHPQSWFTRSFPDPAARAVAQVAAANPGARIYASARWGDWLLWKEPQLAGRIAYDARAELFTSQQVKRMVLMRLAPSLLPEIRRRYRIFLVDRADEPAVFSTLRREGRVAYNEDGVLVVSFPRTRS